jgi:hypothetical protein
MMSDPNLIKKEQTLQEKVESEILNRPSVPKPSTKGPLKALRTYQGDIEEILSKTNGSVTSVVIAEKKRQEEERKEEQKAKSDLIPETKTEQTIKVEPEPEPVKEPEVEQKEEFKPEPIIEPKVEPKPEPPPPPPPPPPPVVEKKPKIEDSIINSLPQQQSTDTFVYNTKPQPEEIVNSEIKNRFFFSFGVALLGLGIIILGVAYYFKVKDNTIIVNQERTIIGYSQKINMNIASSTRRDFSVAVDVEKQKISLPSNSVLYLKTTNGGDSPAEVGYMARFLSPRIPSELVRSLSPNYMFGIYTSSSNEPFIILTQNDFGLSYSGMLQWEKSIISDLSDIFSITSTSTQYVFEDQSFKNKDLRVVKDQNRKTIFLYSFLDKNTILITSNEDVFSGILGKFMTSKVSR